jgi:hypothetical protein
MMTGKNLSWLAALLTVGLALAGSGCSRQAGEGETPAAATAAASPAGDGVYILRVVFRGLVALVPGDGSLRPGEFWALVGNASQPGLLAIHEAADDDTVRLDPHQARLFVRARNVQRSGHLCTGTIPCEDSVAGPWSVLSLNNMHVELAGRFQDTGLQIVANNRRRGDARPCEPSASGCTEALAVAQARSFDWAAPVEPLVAAANGASAQLRRELVEPVYRPGPGRIPLLLARFRFERGTVATRSLARNEQQEVQVYEFTHAESVPAQALATTVTLETAVSGPVTFRITALNRDGSDPPDLVVAPAAGEREVEVWIDNSPAGCMSRGHFLFNYNLLEATNLTRLPRPQAKLEQGGPPVDHGGCSPPKMNMPTGS